MGFSGRVSFSVFLPGNPKSAPSNRNFRPMTEPVASFPDAEHWVALVAGQGWA